MRDRIGFWLTMAALAIGIVASAILFVDYVRPLAVFCDEGGGCATVKHTIYAYPFGLPMPGYGLAGLLAIALAALVPGRIARLVQAGLAIPGALVAGLLLIVQARMGVLCPYCAVVDGSAIIIAGLSLVRLVRAWDPPEGRAVPAAVVASLVTAAAVPMIVGFNRAPPPIAQGEVPPAILEEMKKTPAGMVTVVDFVDYECPFCRRAHAELAPLLAQHAARVRVVRKQVPLRIHPHAATAARAACCGGEKSDALADALFAAKPEDLTEEGCAKVAEELGLDVAKFRGCMNERSTADRIAADRETWRAAGGHSLPMIWIEGTKLEGASAQDRQTLLATLDQALQRR
jgi:protein-disulfide isomerase